MTPSRRPRGAATTTGTQTSEPGIVQHPDGYYWCSEAHEVGPFATFDDARADMDANTVSELAGAGPGETLEQIGPGETLEQIEDDIGVESWIDPETGSLAEEQRPRVEEH
jgi:hypothetical protein